MFLVHKPLAGCHIFYWVTVMNRRELLKSRKVLLNHTFFVYIVCAVLFLCGCVVGIIYSHSIDEGSSIFSLIEGYLGGILENEIFSEDLLGLIFEISGPALISLSWVFRFWVFHLFSFISFQRFFTLFCYIAFDELIDKSGAVFTIILIAIRALISIPSFFMVSVQSVGRIFKIIFIGSVC